MSDGVSRASPWFVWTLLSAATHAFVFGMAGDSRKSPLAFDPRAQTIVGDSVEVDEAPPAEASGGEVVEDGRAEALSPRDEPAAERQHAASPSHGLAAATTPRGHPALFGAVGLRFATDLATTFTRAFPQTASSDRIWLSTPLGAAGTAEVTLVLDESGHLTGRTIGGAPSEALRRGVERTLALIALRTFTASDPVTKLRVTARVARDDAHDGLHGDVFALSGGSFSGNVGSAFFALPAAKGGESGRRVDIELRLAR